MRRRLGNASATARTGAPWLAEAAPADSQLPVCGRARITPLPDCAAASNRSGLIRRLVARMSVTRRGVTQKTSAQYRP